MISENTFVTISKHPKYSLNEMSSTANRWGKDCQFLVLSHDYSGVGYKMPTLEASTLKRLCPNLSGVVCRNIVYSRDISYPKFSFSGAMHRFRLWRQSRNLQVLSQAPWTLGLGRELIRKTLYLCSSPLISNVGLLSFIVSTNPTTFLRRSFITC